MRLAGLASHQILPVHIVALILQLSMSGEPEKSKSPGLALLHLASSFSFHHAESCLRNVDAAAELAFGELGGNLCKPKEAKAPASLSPRR